VHLIKWYILIPICCLLLGSLNAFAQEFRFDNRIPNLQLGSLETYKVIQDKSGYIWLATESGLYRYEAGGSTYIPLDHGPLHAAVLTVYESLGGIILISTIQGRLYKVDGNIAKELPLSKQWPVLHPGELIYRLAEDNKQQLYIMTSVGTYKAKPDYTSAARVSADRYPYFPVQRINGLLLPFNDFFRDNRPAFHDMAHPLKVGFPGLSMDTASIQRYKNAVDVYRVLTADIPQYQLITFSRTLMVIGPDRRLTTMNLPADIITLRTDVKNGVWIGLYKHGYIYIPDITQPHKMVRGMERLSVSDICMDREGGIWATTLERGLWYSNGADLVRHTEESDEAVPFKNLFACGDGVLAGVHGKPTLLIRERGAATPLILADGKTVDGLLSFTRTEGSEYYFTPHQLSIRNTTTGKVERTILHEESVLDVCHLGKDDFALITATWLMRLQHTKIDLVKRMNFFSNKLLVTTDSQVLIGTRNNLFHAKKFFQPAFKETAVSGNILKIEQAPDGSIWILVQNKGLYIMEKGAVRKVLVAGDNEMYYTFSLMRPGEIWLASNQGVWSYRISSLLLPVTNAGGRKKLITMDKAYSMIARKGRIYMATTTGIVSMPVDYRDKSVKKFSIYLRKLRAGDKSIPPADLATAKRFGYNEGALTWTFDVISFRQEQVTMHYALSGPKADSGIINAQTFQLGNIRPGNYKLTIWSTRADGGTSNTLSYLFSVVPPYWQTAGFFIVLILVVIVVVSVIAWRIILRYRNRDLQKRKIEEELLSSRLLALQAQMNPHFIFNAINSIQFFVLYNREQEGYHYLAQFSKLIRRVLMQSRSPLLTLSAELETLALYIELEQLRFPVQFEYIVRIDPQLETEKIYLPVMLLQPVIENAIQHGISDNGIQGRITLEIVHQPAQNCIRIMITDNGVGQQLTDHVPHKTKDDHVPVSSIINRERIDTLNQIYKTTKFDLHNMDLFTTTGTPAGMTVTISIPDNLNAYA